MKQFLDKDFLLTSDTAKELYHDVAAALPIIDYHCHINPQEIYEDKHFETITEAWLGGDHYKWRLLRTNGTPEELVTGDGDPREKFRAYADAVSLAIGNPLYHWSHMELKMYFDYHQPLTRENADEVYDLTNEKLKTMGVREMISLSNVETIVTTDDPLDDLNWHKKLANDPTCTVKVLPGWRPDKAIAITADGYQDYLNRLAEVAGLDSISNLEDLKAALVKRIDYFGENGCSISDHGLNWIPYSDRSELTAAEVFQRFLDGETVSEDEADIFRFDMLVFLGEEYTKRDWVMQYHFNTLRNVNSRMFKILGPDHGYDSMRDRSNAEALAVLLDALEWKQALPKTILYSLNPNEHDMIIALISSFQANTPGKIQLGSAWWFNDTKEGMEEQIQAFAAGSNLGHFVGMLTDSRSFLSYARHDYFRRILCEMVGRWVENGEYPNDKRLINRIVSGISYQNAKEYFRF